MMVRSYLKILLFIVVCSMPYTAYALSRVAKVTLVVVDENEKPLEGADVVVGFEENVGWGTDAIAKKGLTDAEGRFVATGSCNGHIGYGARKGGYYRSHYDYEFKDVSISGWEPWGLQLKVVLRKIGNQVPMYIRNSKTYKKSVSVPVVGKEIGFDLVAYDWVSPYGSGEYSDFIFLLEKEYKNMRDYSGTLHIKFNNKNDGIIKVNMSSLGSVYKLQRYAPYNGYSPELVIETSQGSGRRWIKGFRSDDSYIFRIRSEVEGGEVVKAMYGKIVGPISFEPRIDPTEVYFQYYLNPDGTTNLEHDQDDNLFDKTGSLMR